jgi:hypothetical protein
VSRGVRGDDARPQTRAAKGVSGTL